MLAHHAAAQSLQDLSSLSLEELAQIEVTTVSKRAEPLSQAPAAVFVITSDDIRRSGAATLAEALRLAPNLEVARVNSQTYNISSRGLNSVNASNKLLALIDGRSIYTPFFSAVSWDQQDVMLADIDRIEVISGPGGTLWGANAMNGVINVITRSSAETQGALVDSSVGDYVQRGAARWGGRLGDSGHYRGYVLGGDTGSTSLPNGNSTQDSWRQRQAGFRSDFSHDKAMVTVQGDMYENIVDSPSGRRNGGNLVGRWSRQFADGSSLQVQGYYDLQRRTDTAAAGGGSSNEVQTLDVQVEHSFTAARVHQIVWGVGQRTWRDRFTNTANPFILAPESETLNLTNIFAEDTVALSPSVKLTAGVKFEYSTFSGWEAMPSARIGWQVSPSHFLWSSVSRAVRTPSRLERDLTAPGIVNTSPDFQSEKLIAYEAGWRTQMGPQMSLSASLFVNEYSDLRTTSPRPVTVLPVTFGNGLEGRTWGADVWASYSPLRSWRLTAGGEILRKDFHLKPGESDIAGIQTVLGHDPGHQVFVRSYMDLPGNTELYVGLRQIGSLDDVGVPSYFEADVRLSWHATQKLELALGGMNLVHARHAEATQPPIHEIPRSGYVGLRWSF